MVKISDVWTFNEWKQSIDNQRKETENMKKSLNQKEFYKLALRNYENGGDGIFAFYLFYLSLFVNRS